MDIKQNSQIDSTHKVMDSHIKQCGHQVIIAGRYIITKKITSGSFGKVYSGVDTQKGNQ